MTDPVLHSFDHTVKPASTSGNQMNMVMFFILVAVVVILGTGMGYVVASSTSSKSSVNQNVAAGTKVNSNKAAGVVDKKTFKDNSEGVLREGGIDGEGSFHLERPGGASQYVYLTSTTVDLSGYVGKKVRVWGQTFQGEKAGWLMDVGLIENLN